MNRRSALILGLGGAALAGLARPTRALTPEAPGPADIASMRGYRIEDAANSLTLTWFDAPDGPAVSVYVGAMPFHQFEDDFDPDGNPVLVLEVHHSRRESTRWRLALTTDGPVTLSEERLTHGFQPPRPDPVLRGD